jgi:hypothetical protein
VGLLDTAFNGNLGYLLRGIQRHDGLVRGRGLSMRISSDGARICRTGQVRYAATWQMANRLF